MFCVIKFCMCGNLINFAARNEGCGGFRIGNVERFGCLQPRKKMLKC